MRSFSLLSGAAFVGAALYFVGEEPASVSSQEEPAEQPWAELRRCDGFDLPVGPPNATAYYDAQPFGRNDHLGSDWNGRGGGATDLGDPVFSAADGVVSFSGTAGAGWGEVIMVVHRARSGLLVETLYAHLQERWVAEGEPLRRGEQLGTLGDAGGLYSPHLHFELRSVVGLGVGPGYKRDKLGWVDPSQFIALHRP